MELLRRIVRRVLGWNSPVYRYAARNFNRASILRSEGLETLRQLESLDNAMIGGAEVVMKFSRLTHPFHIRPGMKDASVAIDNFVREEYGAISPPVPPRVMVDAGGFIGDTAAYFLSKYDELHCICFEPMPDSFAQAEKNLAPYGNRAKLFNMALSTDGNPVHMNGTQTGARIDERGDFVVQSRTILQILDDLPGHRIDILKLDIEGAEGAIFAQNPSVWLPRVSFIIVETHGLECTQTVLNALDTAGWLATRVRNLYFCWPAASSATSATLT